MNLQLFRCDWKQTQSEDYDPDCITRFETAFIWAETAHQALLVFKADVVGTDDWDEGVAEVNGCPVPARKPGVLYSHGGYDD